MTIESNKSRKETYMELNIENRNVYVISDIHNDYDSFEKMLQLIQFTADDLLIVTGDIFDRGPKPVETYFELLKYENIIALKGNHDVWLKNEIMDKISGEKTGRYLSYNSFELLQKRLTEIDLLNLAKWIDDLPYYINLCLDGTEYQISHAQTFPTPGRILDKYKILMGDGYYEVFLAGRMELKDKISVVGHTPTDNYKIWISETGKTIRIDCGCGYNEGRLGAIRLNDMQEFYVE